MTTPPPGTFGAEDLTTAYLEPIESEAQINYDYVYALFTFVATMEGQISVLKGEELELLDDSNSYWWAVKCIKSNEIGYIPAENIESPQERLARLNRKRNVENNSNYRSIADPPKKNRPKLRFASEITEFETEVEYPSSKATFEEEIEEIKDSPVSTPKKKKFLDKFFKTKKRVVEDLPEVKTPTVAQPDNSADAEPINVLRIYPGNFTSNTTFKSVSFDRNTDVKSLMTNSLKKFRVTDKTIDYYYMTITPIDEITGEILKQSTKPVYIDERRLYSDENINSVLGSFGVMSFLSETDVKDSHGRRTSASRVRQADGTVVFSIYVMENSDQSEKNTYAEICVYYENDFKNVELIEIKQSTLVKDIIVKAKIAFQCDFEDSYGLYSTFSKSYLDPDKPVYPLVVEANAAKSPLTVILKGVETPKREMVEAPFHVEEYQPWNASDDQMKQTNTVVQEVKFDKAKQPPRSAFDHGKSSSDSEYSDTESRDSKKGIKSIGKGLFRRATGYASSNHSDSSDKSSKFKPLKSRPSKKQNLSDESDNSSYAASSKSSDTFKAQQTKKVEIMSSKDSDSNSGDYSSRENLRDEYRAGAKLVSDQQNYVDSSDSSYSGSMDRPKPKPIEITQTAADDNLTQLQSSLKEFLDDVMQPIGEQTQPSLSRSKSDSESTLTRLKPANDQFLMAPKLNGKRSSLLVPSSVDKQIERIVEQQFDTTSINRKKSRLSQLYNLNVEHEEVDSTKIFEDLKDVGDKLNRIDNVI